MECHLAAESLQQVADFIGDSKIVALDTEDTSLNPRTGEICGIGLSPDGIRGMYIPTKHAYTDNLDIKEVLPFLQKLLDGRGIFIHNAKFDAEYIYQQSKGSWDIWKTNKVIDTMILAYMWGKFSRIGLKPLTKELFNYEMLELKDLFGGKKTNIQVEKLDINKILDYACDDPIYTYKLGMYLLPKIKASPMRDICKTEMDLIKYVQKMERFGIHLNTEHLASESAKLDELILKTEKLVFDEASAKIGQPVEFNIGSTKDVGEILFDYMQLPVLGTTATGKRSTDEKTLSKMAVKYSIVRNILTWRRLITSKSRYTDPLPSYVEPDGKIHTSFNQTAAASGRFASSDPNLQNIPVKGRDPFKIVNSDGDIEEHEVDVRKAFEATEDYTFLDPDYSQIEYKALVGEAGETSYINAFNNGVDFHGKVAQETGTIRSKAKTTNFRLQYGGGPAGLAEDLDISLEEAKEIVRKREESMPAVGVYRQNALLNMRRLGYVQTRFGRRRYSDGLNSPDRKERAFYERSMYNTLIQGVAADVLKMGMVRLGKLIDERYGEEWEKVRMILTIHDEILLEVRNDIPLIDVWNMCKEAMEIQVDGWPRITIDAKFGTSWGEMSHYEPETDTKPESKSLQASPVILGDKPTSATKPEEKMPVIGGKKIILSLKEPLTKPKLLELLELFDSHPGPNVFTVRTETQDYVIGKHLTALSLENVGLINTVIACEPFVDISEIPLETLI